MKLLFITPVFCTPLGKPDEKSVMVNAGDETELESIEEGEFWTTIKIKHSQTKWLIPVGSYVTQE